MIEKRFTYDKPLVAFSKGGINDNVTGETYEFTMDTVLDLLNELHEENEDRYNEQQYLQQQIYSRDKTIEALEKENEQSRKELRNLRRLANELYMEGSE